MKIVIADTGALISLGHVDLIELIPKVFGEFYIAEAVWEELLNYDNPNFEIPSLNILKSKVVPIKSKNYLSVVMDYGESESVILYEEMQADYLLIDDNKARKTAESLDVNCIGSVGLLIMAKRKGLVKAVRPIFQKWLSLGRYFSKALLNDILAKEGENSLSS